METGEIWRSMHRLWVLKEIHPNMVDLAVTSGELYNAWKILHGFAQYTEILTMFPNPIHKYHNDNGILSTNFRVAMYHIFQSILRKDLSVIPPYSEWSKTSRVYTIQLIIAQPRTYFVVFDHQYMTIPCWIAELNHKIGRGSTVPSWTKLLTYAGDIKQSPKTI